MEKSVRDGIEYTLATSIELRNLIADLFAITASWHEAILAFERKTNPAELGRLEAPDCAETNALASRIIARGGRQPPDPPIPALYGLQARLVGLFQTLPEPPEIMRVVLIDLDANPVDPLSFVLLHAARFRQGEHWRLPCQY